MLNLEALLAETKDSPPCGPNLEHDLVFFELEDAARGKPEQRVGDSVKAGEDPNWPKVLDLAQGLLLRTKDLRVTIHLTRALTRTEGIPGLAAGLSVIHGLLERYWDGVHPVLEADQDNDPTERIFALHPLADSGSQPGTADHTVIKDLRDVELLDSRRLGRVQARDVEIALGRLAPLRTDTATVPKTLGEIQAEIAAAFTDDRTVLTALRQARERVSAISALLVDRVGVERAPDLKPLGQCLDSLIETCEPALGTRSGVADGSAVASGDAVATGGRPVIDGQISSRQEAVRLLEMVCHYLERHEPSNPAPLFIRRAQRLMTKNFVEIVKDLLPDSLANIELLAGEIDTNKKDQS